MKWIRAFLLLTLVLVVARAGAQEYVPDEVLVKFRTGLPSAAALHAAVPNSVAAEHLGALGVTVVRLPRGYLVRAAVRRFAARPDVEFAEPNYIAHTCDIPNDPGYGDQWALPKIGAPAGWDVLINADVSTSVRVAVLDTGIQQSHPDLQGVVVAGKDFTGNRKGIEDGNGHGTHTAGTVAALTNNGTGVASLGRGYVGLMIGKVLNDRGSGTYSAIANGITWAYQNGARVISMSLGGSSGSSTLQSAVNNAWNAGVVVVAAAGNNGNTAPSYPAYYTNCIAVAATDQGDARASFSTYGSWVDVAAPGVNILSTYKRSQYAYASGTSMATPHVAALAALVWAKGSATTATSVRSKVVGTGDPVSTGFGAYPIRRINVESALQ